MLAVLETCPQDPTLRLTLQKPTPKDNDKPEELYSAVLPGVERGSAAKVLAVADTRSAVYLPGTRNELVVFDDRGMRVGATVLPGEISRRMPPPRPAMSSPGGRAVRCWFSAPRT